MDTDKKRILIFSPFYHHDPRGRVEEVIREVTDRLVLPNVEFHLLAGRQGRYDPPTEWVGNVLLYRFGPPHDSSHGTAAHLPRREGFWHMLRALWYARKLQKEYGYCGVWAPAVCGCGIVAALFKRLYPSVGYVQTLHEGADPHAVEQTYRSYGGFFRRMFTLPTVIHATSTALADWARAQGAQCPVEVVPNAVWAERVEEVVSEEAVTAAERKLDHDTDDVWLLSTAPLVPESGIDLIIPSLTHLPENVKLAVVGTGPEEAALRKKVLNLYDQKRVVFVGDVAEEDLSAYLQVCDIYVAPARKGGDVRTCLRAYAAAMPVVATKVDAMVDVLRDERDSPDGFTCLTVPIDNSDEIARRVLRILDMADDMTDMLARARSFVQERYVWNGSARALFSRVFNRVLDL